MTNALTISILRLPGAEDLPLPSYQTSGSAGMDLHAAVDEPLTIAPGARASVPVGFSVAVPEGYEAQVRARSGSARHHGICLANGVGTVDSDYRGPVQVLLVNLGDAPFEIRRGDRIAQMVIAPVIRAEWREVDSLDETARGAGGFGHTGRATAA
jgi:dUTP pyrophosphatase